jgi:UDP-GlcNAc3NAcA epimerase
MKVLTIVGARQKFIKSGAVSQILRGQVGISEILVHTGQHFDPEMSDVFFREMDTCQPDYNLGISGGKKVRNVPGLYGGGKASEK